MVCKSSGSAGSISAAGHHVCQVHPNLQEAGAGVRPDCPSTEAASAASLPGRGHGQSCGAEARDDQLGVLRVPLLR